MRETIYERADSHLLLQYQRGGEDARFFDEEGEGFSVKNLRHPCGYIFY
jgi:hypothetical protein